MTESTPYTVPKEPGRWRAIMLAVLVHAALFIFLWVGVRWQSETPATIEAEVWSPEPREAAPAPPPVKQPEPVKEPEPRPAIKETPKPAVEEPPVKKPDIALEQEKKRKAELEKKRLEQEQQAKLKQKAEEERQAKLKQEQERLAKQKAEEQRIAKDKAAKQKALEEAKRKQEEEQQQLIAAMHAQNMKRIEESLGGGNGSAAKAQGGPANMQYAARVQAKIKSNIIFNAPDSLSTNPAVEFEVNLLPDGSIAGMRKLKSSGLPGWDEAVARAIEKSQPFPKDQSGKVPSSFVGNHRPKDK